MTDPGLELLGRGETIRFVARGGSMRPFIRDGDRVTVGPLRGPPRAGDVVLAPGGEFALLHRALWVVGGWVLVKGDGMARPDGWFRQDALLGRLVSVERGGEAIPVRRWRAVAWSVLGGVARVAVQGRRRG